MAVNPAIAEPQEDLPPLLKLSPETRSAPISPFAGLSCEQLSRTQAKSEAERRQLTLRKQECLNTYRQFIPQRHNPNLGGER